MMFLNKATKDSNRGFTLIEILIVMGLIAVLAAIVLVAINPARQFAQARDSQRTSNVNAILNAVGQNLADNAGIFNRDPDNDGTNDCPALPDPGDPEERISSEAGDLDIRGCLVPAYMPELPFDPADGIAYDDSTDDYDTAYTIALTPESRIQVCTDDISQTQEPALGRTDPICVTR